MLFFLIRPTKRKLYLMKVFKTIFSMVLIALSVTFMSCSKDSEPNELELSKVNGENIIGAWSCKLSNGNEITYFFKDSGTVLWQEKTSEGVVTVEDLRYLYNKSTLIGRFIFDRPNVKRSFKFKDNTLHVYAVEGEYTYFERSNNKPEPPTAIIPEVIPEPSKPIIPEVTPEPPKPVVPEFVGKWRFDGNGYCYIYVFKADGTFEHNEFKGDSKIKTKSGRFTYNSKTSRGVVIFENDGSNTFKFNNDVISVNVFFGDWINFRRIA